MAARDSDTFISNNERSFITEALSSGCRLDGRQLYQYRQVKFQFASNDSGATVTLGKTRVAAFITATLEAPYPDRPSEGSIIFNVECGPMASPAFEPGRPGPDAVQLARLVQRALKQSGAVDCEALCVLAGRKVWTLRCDIHVLDHAGNLVDACILAGLAAVLVYRKPATSMGGDAGTEVVVHPREQKEPQPLTIHHNPVSVTWALVQTPKSGLICVLDPSLKEQAAQAGSATFIVNTSNEVCGVHKAEGVGLTAAEVMRLTRLSCKEAETMMGLLKEALAMHDVERVAARVRRTERTPFTSSQSRHVTISAAQGEPGSAVPTAGSGLPTDNSSPDSSESSDIEENAEPSSSSSDDDMEQGGSTAGRASTGKAGTSQPKAQLRGKVAIATDKPVKQEVKVETDTAPATSAKLGDKRVAQRNVLDENLETIAALIAGSKPGADDEDEASLASAVKKQNVQKKKKK